MSDESSLVVSRATAVATVLAVLAVGAGGTWIFMRDRPAPSTPAPAPTAGSTASAMEPPSPPAEMATDDGPWPDVVVPLAKDAAERAGIEVAAVVTRVIADELRLPGAVEANAYRQVAVTPLVGGRVVRVSAQLGDRVRRGQSIAQVYSPELADARTTYLAASARLEAHDREMQRTEKLVEIGAASRQELDRVNAEHAAQVAEVEGARSRLQLLGASTTSAAGSDSRDAAATTDVPAPIDGVVTERLVNVGLNVDPATQLFTIVDLSSIWVIANAYERDLHRVQMGSRATITAKAYPNLALSGRISYIDPQLSEETRTAKVRIEVANPRGELRLGMFADVIITGVGGTSVLTIPESAVQNIGRRQVVYLPAPNDPAAFTEREIQTGRALGGAIEVVSGLSAADSVVSRGSFFIRAEAERLGIRTAAVGRRATDPKRPGAGSLVRPGAQTAKVVVSEKGFEPTTVSLRAGTPASITFVRTTDQTCGTEIVFPSLDITRALPLDEPVTIEFTPASAEAIAFACGMNMLRGTVVVQ